MNPVEERRNKKPLKSNATTLQAVWESLFSQIWVRLLYSDGYWLGQARHISSRGQGSDMKIKSMCRAKLFYFFRRCRITLFPLVFQFFYWR